MREAYRMQQAHVMAIALSRLTGLPLGLIVGESPGEEDSTPVTIDYGHAVVIVDADRAAWLDVDGLHVGLGATAFRFGAGIDRVTMIPATEESVLLAYGRPWAYKPVDISDTDLDTARRFIEADPELQAALTDTRSPTGRRLCRSVLRHDRHHIAAALIGL